MENLHFWAVIDSFSTKSAYVKWATCLIIIVREVYKRDFSIIQEILKKSQNKTLNNKWISQRFPVEFLDIFHTDTKN